MPARTGPSSCSTVLPIFPRPSARSVPRCRWLWPISLRTCVIRTFAILILLRNVGRGGLGALLFVLRCFVRQDLADREAAGLRDLLGPAEALEPVDRRLRHVDRIRRAEALREDVADAGELEHGAHAATGDDAGSLARRPEQHARGVGTAEDLVRDRRPVLRDGEEVLLRVLDGLGDRKRHLARLAIADADPVDLVANDHERGEREATPALDDLCDAVDLDDALLELARLLTLDYLALDRSEIRPRAQNFSPPSRAASASAFTRPWNR